MYILREIIVFFRLAIVTSSSVMGRGDESVDCLNLMACANVMIELEYSASALPLILEI